MRHCVGGGLGLQRAGVHGASTGVKIDGGEHRRAGPAVCSAFPGLYKSFSPTQSAESPSPQIPARTGPAAGAVSRPALLEENAGRAGRILGRLLAGWNLSSPVEPTDLI